MPFHFRRLEIHDIILIEPEVYEDFRGFFRETYKHSDFVRMGIKEHFVQDNHSKSVKGVLRGLHYQKNPNAQGKLVQCIKGKIFDAAVDIRKGSLSFGQWVGVVLSEKNNLILYVPPAFAHGFVVLSKSAEVLYKCTGEYSPEDDRGIIWDDPDIGIKWPVKHPVLSEKDLGHPRLSDADNNFEYPSIAPLPGGK
ncbi:MAG: dTDP-4-dehydrorhamnose 3,5-epimerase [Nitrospirae bacterium]|jgi:dTDP-4-dehydrorhamnose 3,5-epimerase|nr:dTDP-4-dehydrorhamnose 3,5-epimerase [Nitrospirota bacterium]